MEAKPAAAAAAAGIAVGNMEHWLRRPPPPPKPPETSMAPRPLLEQPASLDVIEEMRAQLAAATDELDLLIATAARKVGEVEVARAAQAAAQADAAATASAGAAAELAAAAAELATNSAAAATDAVVDVRAEVDRLRAAAGGPRLSTGRRAGMCTPPPGGQSAHERAHARQKDVDTRWVGPSKTLSTRPAARIGRSRRATESPSAAGRRRSTPSAQPVEPSPPSPPPPPVQPPPQLEPGGVSLAAMELMQALPATFFRVCSPTALLVLLPELAAG